ncbi:DUF536 domain-containing protein [Staphylococcus sp. 231237_7MaSpsaltlick]|uniref:DUF536 domain-containing protein n=1 Tax=Staphylococcus sp. 231237_7MaSpsaltlick TaxID=3367518 RepID=UPI00370B8B62
MKTFKEVSEELKITKQTLTSWIKELNESNSIIWKNKTRYLDETLVNKIKHFKSVESKDEFFSENKSKNFDEIPSETLLENLEKENELLVKQITIKDELIKDLTKLIDQQQQLTISDKKEKDELKSELKIALNYYDYNEEIKNYSQVEESEQKNNSQHQRKKFQNTDIQGKGFWKKLFGKK